MEEGRERGRKRKRDQGADTNKIQDSDPFPLPSPTHPPTLWRNKMPVTRLTSLIFYPNVKLGREVAPKLSGMCWKGESLRPPSEPGAK